MAMKLLSPGEARDKAQKSESGAKYRLVELQTLIAQKYRELASVEDDFDKTLQKQRNQWAAERQEHENHITELGKKVEALEERKRQALLPLTERAKELDTKASALDEREETLDRFEAGLLDEANHLTTRLDEVAEREIQADKVAKTLKLREEGVQAQAAQVTTGSALLTAAVASAAQESTERERQLDLREAALKAKEGNLVERERKVNETTADFDRREAVIRDERLALNRAVEEINKKHGTQ